MERVQTHINNRMLMLTLELVTGSKENVTQSGA